MNPALLDTDTLSWVLEGRRSVTSAAERYLAEHRVLTFSEMTRFEVLRGLEAKRAQARIERFMSFCRTCEVLPITTPILDRAALVYGELHRAGTLIPDADLIIGVTALELGYDMVTNNVRHFSRIPGLRIVNWLDDRGA